MVVILGFRAALIAAFVVTSAMGIERSREQPSDAWPSNGKSRTIITAPHSKAAIKPETPGAASSRKSLKNAGGEMEKEDNSTEKQRPCYVCGKKRSPDSMVDLEKAAVANRLKRVADLLTKKLQLDPKHNGHSNRAVGQVSGASPAPTNLPQTLLDIFQDEEEADDFYAWDKMRIYTGEEVKHGCIHGRGTECYSFQFEGRLKVKFVSAHLWLHKPPCANSDRRRIVKVSKHLGPRHSRLLANQSFSGEQDWLKIDLTYIVRRWARYERPEQVTLAVSCFPRRNFQARAESESKHKPLLAIEFARELAREQHVRVKRSETECYRTTQCCKVPLIIDPTSLNINQQTNFVSTSLTINYCFGSCLAVEAYENNHTLFRLKHRETVSSSDGREQLEACCAPTRLGPGAISMMLSDGNTVVRQVPEVKVLECGCV